MDQRNDLILCRLKGNLEEAQQNIERLLNNGGLKEDVIDACVSISKTMEYFVKVMIDGGGCAK